MARRQDPRQLAQAACAAIDTKIGPADRLLVEASIWESFGFTAEATERREAAEEARRPQREAEQAKVQVRNFMFALGEMLVEAFNPDAWGGDGS